MTHSAQQKAARLAVQRARRRRDEGARHAKGGEVKEGVQRFRLRRHEKLDCGEDAKQVEHTPAMRGSESRATGAWA